MRPPLMHAHQNTPIRIANLPPDELDVDLHDATKTPPQLGQLRDRDYLEWLYFQMASLARLSALVARKNRQITARRAAPTG